MIAYTLLLALTTTVAPQNPPSTLSAPLAFEVHETALVARSAGSALAIDRAGATLRVVTAAGQTLDSRCELVAANPDATLLGRQPTPRRVNRLLGNDPARWQIGVRTVAQAVIAGAWTGIDAVWHGRNGELEYDFVVAAAADPALIRLRFAGQSPRLGDDGSLRLRTARGDIVHRAPLAWQQSDGLTEPVEVRFVLEADDTVTFAIGDYDAGRELVIDPVVTFASLLDGSGADQQARIAVDALGQAVVAGYTASLDMPVQNAAFAARNGSTDIFVAKFTADGSDVLYATYLGGSGGENPGGVAVLPSGAAVIACRTASLDYPLANAAFPNPLGFGQRAAISVLSDTGGLLWSTYYGRPAGGTFAPCQDVATGPAGEVVICGYTADFDLVTHQGTYQATRLGAAFDGYVAKFSAGGGFVGATYLGSVASTTIEPRDITVAADGRIAIGGRTRSVIPAGTVGGAQTTFGGGIWDAFVAVFDSSLTSLTYSSLHGGSRDESEHLLEQIGVAFAANGDVVLCGHTESTDLPVTANAMQSAFGGVLDGFIARFDTGGAGGLVYATYLGGNQSDGLADIVMDAAGRYCVVGHTRSPSGLPFVGAVHTLTATPTFSNAYVGILAADGSRLEFSTPFGNNSDEVGEGIGLGPDNSIYIGGNCTSSGFPTTSGAYQAQPAPISSRALFAVRLDIPGDECTAAVPVVVGTNGPHSNAGTTASATAWPCGAGTRLDMWFTFTASCTAPFTFSTCTPTRDFDTVLEVFGGDCAALSSLGCSDDACGSGSRLTVNLTQNTTYRLRVGGDNAAIGSFDLTVEPGTGAGSLTTIPHGCAALTFAVTGPPRIGGTLTSTLSGHGGAPFVGFGFNLTPSVFCGCTLGHDWAAVLFGASQPLAIPCHPSFIGAQIGTQGADLGGPGGCANPPFALSDTVIITIG